VAIQPAFFHFLYGKGKKSKGWRRRGNRNSICLFTDAVFEKASGGSGGSAGSVWRRPDDQAMFVYEENREMMWKGRMKDSFLSLLAACRKKKIKGHWIRIRFGDRREKNGFLTDGRKKMAHVHDCSLDNNDATISGCLTII